MTQHQVYLLSLSGTVTIWFGGLWMLFGGIGYLLRRARHGSPPGPRSLARSKRRLEQLLGEPELPAPAAQRAIRAAAQYGRFRTWTRWAFRFPLLVMIAGELLHLSANFLMLHLQEHVDTWRVVSNGVGLVGSVLLTALIARLLLGASPRLVIMRQVLGTARLLAAITEDRRGDHVDRVMRQIGRLEQTVTTYFTLSHPAGDPHTRARLVAVGNGLYGLLVDAKQDLLFADALTLMTTRQTLWLTAAAAAADPSVLTDAERAASGSDRAIDAVRPRLVYRTAAVVTIVAVVAAIVGLWYVDHSALSVIFSAVAAPLLVPAIVGFARRGWNHSEAGRGAAEQGEAIRGEAEHKTTLMGLATEIADRAKHAAPPA
jgi:hypothetical protein